MIRKFRIFLLLLAVVFSLVSCLSIDSEERTKEMEMDELNLYLSNLVTGGYNIDTTALGLYYVKIADGQGAYPKKGDTLSVGYAGYFVNGAMFESTFLNTADSTMIFRFLEERMIPGFEDGMKMMNEGTRMQLIIPSDLAYGSYGSYSIPAYTTLIFVVKMVDIRPVASN